MGRSPRKNLLADPTVAIVALPLALGTESSSGAGAKAGLATAPVASALAAVLGGSNARRLGCPRGGRDSHRGGFPVTAAAVRASR
ncbi:hypothetical protein [Streptomyces sp. NRRL B-24484]|uniref:hypothetical protein n=1 Tax=Streptomyces sp. NRRL B-24484 TaxID=1463833 RepID=UPI001902737A|nr:hypothetical protein [Streptomyces sp. NRRL B-24484]